MADDNRLVNGEKAFLVPQPATGGGAQYTLYARRWGMLGIVMMLQICNAMLWITVSCAGKKRRKKSLPFFGQSLGFHVCTHTKDDCTDQMHWVS